MSVLLAMLAAVWVLDVAAIVALAYDTDRQPRTAVSESRPRGWYLAEARRRRGIAPLDRTAVAPFRPPPDDDAGLLRARASALWHSDIGAAA